MKKLLVIHTSVKLNVYIYGYCRLLVLVRVSVAKAKAFPGLLVNEIINDSRKRKISATLDVCFSNST